MPRRNLSVLHEPTSVRRAAPEHLGPAAGRSGAYFLETFGCQMNDHDSERMAGLMEVAGYRRVPTPEQADVAILNTCAIRENAANKLYGHLGHLKPIKDRTGVRVVVAGCQAEQDREGVVERAPWVDVVFGTRNIDALPRLLRSVEEAGVPIVEFAEQFDAYPSALPARRGSSFHAWVAIQFGCNNACTFCIVPSVRGGEVSRPVGDVLGEVRELMDAGVTEISLLGQNVNSYGRDLTGRPIFSELLYRLDEIPGLRRVWYTSPHPKDFKEDTARAMADCDVVCEHLHFPLQSGSDTCLRRMKRAYTRSTYLEKVEMAREIIPGLSLSTDVIVGFPGETDEEFEDTMSIVEEVRYDSAYMFQYSKRPGTPAADMDGQVPKAAVQERFDRLLRTQEQISRERNETLVGQTVDLTIERTASKKNADRASGRTRTNKLVHVPAGDLEAGDACRTRVTEAQAHYLVGERT